MYVPVSVLTLQKANSNTEQSSNDVSEESVLSPTSFLDLPSDLDLDLDLSSLQPEIGRLLKRLIYNLVWISLLCKVTTPASLNSLKPM